MNEAVCCDRLKLWNDSCFCFSIFASRFCEAIGWFQDFLQNRPSVAPREAYVQELPFVQIIHQFVCFFLCVFFVGLVDDLESRNAWIWMRQILLGVFFLSKFEEITNKEPTYPIRIFKNQQMIWELKDLMAGKKPGEGSTLMDLVSWLLPRSKLEMDGQKWQNSKSALFASSFVWSNFCLFMRPRQ